MNSEEPQNQNITVVVKTPDQTSGDFVIECSELWTVRNIKTHIFKCHPLNPNEKHQKIIYSGKLLADTTVLKDVFREQDDKRHTVHLVCVKMEENVKSSSTSSSSSSTTSLPQSTSAQQSTSVSGGISDSQSTTDGLRHRSDGANSSYSPYSYPYNYGGYQMQYGGNIPSSSYYQAYWMQQYYAQQMAQYAQYSNQQLTTPPNALNANPAPVVNLAAPQPVVPNVNIANNAQPAQNNVRMNAGVGPAIDDDEDDQLNRDWLDWSYMFFRATVLISIVYFYSSMNRFMIVIGFISFFYLYRQRHVALQRRLEVEAAAAAAASAAAAAASAATGNGAEDATATENRSTDTPDEEQQQNSEQPETQQEDANESENTEAQTESAEEETPPEPPRPGVFATAWIFCSSFFTSLIPHQPPAANLN